MEWPNDAVRLSYPDWIVARLRAELGDDAEPALARMNEPAPVSVREDGYRQDLASQWVAAAVEAQAGERVLDLCAAPVARRPQWRRRSARGRCGSPDPSRPLDLGCYRGAHRCRRATVRVFVVRQGARRCAMQRAGHATPSSRRTVEDQRERRRRSPGCRRRSSLRSGWSGRGDLGVQRVHADRRGVDRPSDAPRVRVDRDATFGSVAAVRARLAGAPPGRMTPMAWC